MERVTAAPGMMYVVIAGTEVIDADFDRLVGWLRAAMAAGGNEEEDA